MVEGLGCILAGAFGTGTGTKSYSENIGAIGITNVSTDVTKVNLQGEKYIKTDDNKGKT